VHIAVLFDGAGLARHGLEQAGHTTEGYELDPWKHYLSELLCKGPCHNTNAMTISFERFDAVWASPPCQHHSAATFGKGGTHPLGNKDALAWSLTIDSKVLWVENVIPNNGAENNRWGLPFNAAQFTLEPIQNRPRLVGGRFLPPRVYRDYQYRYDGVCPTIMASEWKGCKYGCKSDDCCKSRAARFYKRRLTLEECAYHQGLRIPETWYIKPPQLTNAQWDKVLYEAIGNGVPTYMAKAFGDVYKGE
jgi:site-specific DNA-cytosine methylase